MGARLGAVTEADAVEAIVGASCANTGYWTITANLDHLRRYNSDSLSKELIDTADLVVADGAPLVWASRLARAPLPERVAGSSMIWSICEAASERGRSVFLLGGDPGVAERAAEVLVARFRALHIAGTSCPEMGFDADARAIEAIQREVAEAAPQIVFVALGFPKQDVLIRHLRRSLPHASFLGVGIALSYVAGDVSPAPQWTQRLGLEWAYRLVQEPKRLARRYLVDGLPFAVKLLTAAALQRRRRGSSSNARGWGYCDKAHSLNGAPGSTEI